MNIMKNEKLAYWFFSFYVFREFTSPMTAAIGFLPGIASFSRKKWRKMLFTSLGWSVLEETMSLVLKTSDTVSSHMDFLAGE